LDPMLHRQLQRAAEWLGLPSAAARSRHVADVLDGNWHPVDVTEPVALAGATARHPLPLPDPSEEGRLLRTLQPLLCKIERVSLDAYAADFATPLRSPDRADSFVHGVENALGLPTCTVLRTLEDPTAI